MARPIPRNRTPEWGRLQRTDFFKIDDQPGEIIVSKSGYPFYLCLIMAVIFGFGPMLLSPFIFPLGLLFGGLWVWGAFKTLNHGFKVRFTPDRLTFYGPLGNDIGSLPREAMQQIAVKDEKDKHGQVRSHYHEFVADTGWMQAFHSKGETQAAVQNNVLMAAFAQPLHLDLLDAGEPDYVPPAPGDPFANLKPRQVGRA